VRKWHHYLSVSIDCRLTFFLMLSMYANFRSFLAELCAHARQLNGMLYAFV